MTRSLRRAACAWFSCALAWTASAQSASGPDALAKLVPEGTCVFVEVPSLDRFAEKAQKAASVWESFDVDTVFANFELPFSSKRIDHSKPLGFCIDLPASLDAEPATTLLLPSSNPQELVQELQASGTTLHATSEGGYLILSSSADLKPGDAPAAIAANLPPGEIVARVDVKSIVARFRAKVDAYLAMARASVAYAAREEGPLVAAMIQIIGNVLQATVDSGETLDLAIRIDGPRCELVSSLRTLEGSDLASLGSKEKTDLLSMSRYLDADAPMTWLGGIQPVDLARRSKPVLDGLQKLLPESMRAGFAESLRSLDDLAAVMGNALCIGGHASPDGIRCAAYLQPKDPKKLVAVCRTLLQSIPNVSLGEPKEVTVEGVATKRMRLQVDAKALAGADPEDREILNRLLGKEGLQLSFATKGAVTAVVLGGDEEYQKTSVARLASRPLPEVDGVVRALGQIASMNPALIVHYDVGRLEHEIGAMLPDAVPQDFRALPNLPASATCWFGADGRTIEAAVSVDVPELAAFKIAWEKALEAPSAEPTEKK